MPQWTTEQAFDLALKHHQSGRLQEAEQLYRGILARQPLHVDALHFLGVLAKQTGATEIAERLIRRAVELKPDYPEAQFNLGIVLKGNGNLDEAIVAYRQAFLLRPGIPDVHNNLAAALTEKGLVDEALAAARQAIAIDLRPGKAGGFTNLLFALFHDEHCSPAQLLETAREWAKHQPVYPTTHRSPLSRDDNPNRKLRVGYLSPFFVTSPEAHFIFPLLAHHDRTLFEVYGYTRSDRTDEITTRLQSFCDRWTNLRYLDAPQAIEQMRRDETDILVNISRPADEYVAMFANRIAPIQVNWLTFGPFTTGLDAMDYRISDPIIDPAGADENCYSEKTMRLPQTAWCYDPLAASTPTSPTPAIANGFVTFGSLNRFSKINPLVVAAWAEILKSTQNSRLHIVAVQGDARNNMLDRFARAGVDPGRITFLDRAPRPRYLEQFDRIDIMLDTFPYGGHTTIFDSLFMGAPVVTCSSKWALGRAAASALHQLQLDELVGYTPADYVKIAVDLAHDVPRLTHLRATLRQRMQASTLMDAPRFARNMEAAYRKIWMDRPLNDSPDRV